MSKMGTLNLSHFDQREKKESGKLKKIIILGEKKILKISLCETV